MEAMEFSAVVEQWLEAHVTTRVGCLDLTDEDRVIAGRIRVDRRALDLRQGILQDREPHDTGPIAGAFELFGAAARGREAPRDLLVVQMQDVDREAAVGLKGLIALRGVRDAHEHERGIEGDGRDRAGGETGWMSRRIPRRYHGDTGSEMTQHPAEIVSA